MTTLGSTPTRMGAWSGLASGKTTPETMALWFLVALELLAMGGLRHYFRKHHGG